MAHKVIGYSYFGLKAIHIEKDLGIPKQSLWRRGSLLAWRKPAVPATRCIYILNYACKIFLSCLTSNWTGHLIGHVTIKQDWRLCFLDSLDFPSTGEILIAGPGSLHQCWNILPWIFFERTLFTSFHAIWETPPVEQEDKRNLHLLLEQLRFWRSSNKSFKIIFLQEWHCFIFTLCSLSLTWSTGWYPKVYQMK